MQSATSTLLSRATGSSKRLSEQDMHTALPITEPAASATCEAVPLHIRQSSMSALIAVNLIGQIGIQPHLTQDRNGRGKIYTKLQYRPAHDHWRSLYLGDLNTNDENMLRTRITEKWPFTRSELGRTIIKLRARLRRCRGRARDLAGLCGCRFHGTLLRIPSRS